MMKIGVIGLGRMGSGIAQNLLKAGHEVTVWNRAPGPAAMLAAKGAVAAQMVQETLQGDVLVSMLADDAAMRALGLDGTLLGQAARGLIHVNMATISAGFARELAAAHARHGLGYVAAPVFGRPDAAADAQLVPVVAGPPAQVEKILPLLEQVGRRVVRAGDEAEKANLVKIAGNFMIASQMEAIGEAFALLRKGGVAPGLLHALLSERLFSGVVFQNYGGMILREDYEPAGFALRLGLKDVNLAREAAHALDMTMPSADLVAAQYDDAVAQGWGEKDWAALGGIIAKKAGL